MRMGTFGRAVSVPIARHWPDATFPRRSLLVQAAATTRARNTSMNFCNTAEMWRCAEIAMSVLISTSGSKCTTLTSRSSNSEAENGSTYAIPLLAAAKLHAIPESGVVTTVRFPQTIGRMVSVLAVKIEGWASAMNFSPARSSALTGARRASFLI